MSFTTIDFVEGVAIHASEHLNEVRTLQMLSAGLMRIAFDIRRRELDWEQANHRKVNVQIYGLDIDGTKGDLDLIACLFHWFGVSLVNYARLVGFIKALSNKEFTRSDFSNPAKFRKNTQIIDHYVKAVPEMASVLRWRNKVGAHFAITAPHKDDNVATLDMSVMFPVTFTNGRYRVGELTLTLSNSTGSHSSEIPCWSITEVFESLLARYWPNVSVLQ
jgi:hypothetical protein